MRTSEFPLMQTSAPPSWRPSTRIGFRLLFCYLLQYALCCGNSTIWRIMPMGGHRTEVATAELYLLPAQWLGAHAFGLRGAAAILHPTPFGDRALDWIAFGIMVALALAATAVWTVLDRRRTEYATLLRWLLFLLRLTLAVAMFNYAIWKIFAVQMPPPSLAVLNENVGNTSPLTMLWTVLGLSPTYERICGFTELTCGLLLLCRRTALSGALLSIVVLANVVLFDCFFDVPVKLFAMNLLLMAVVLVLPDARALINFLWLRKPAVTANLWTPPAHRLRIVFLLLECGVILIPGLTETRVVHRKAAEEASSLRNPSPLTGVWHIDSAIDSTATPQPFLTGDRQPLTDLVFEPNGRVNLRDSGGMLRDSGRYDAVQHTLRLQWLGTTPVSYGVHNYSGLTLELAPLNGDSLRGGQTDMPTLRLTRVPVPVRYRLFERGFHLVDEWGYEQ